MDPDDANPLVSALSGPPDQFLGTDEAKPPIGYLGADTSTTNKFSLRNYKVTLGTNVTGPRSLHIRQLATSANDFRLMEMCTLSECA